MPTWHHGGPPPPGSMYLRPQRSGGRIVRPGSTVEDQPPNKTTRSAPKRVRQSAGRFSVDQPEEGLDPKNVPDDQVERFDASDARRTRSGSFLLRWFDRFAPGSRK